jgi:DNA polymerase III gamma/tau subunit
MELYKKYRPSKFSEVRGQNDVIRPLIDFGKRKSIPHFLLFTGPSGCGKTTIARILKGKLNCGDMDFYELNVADFRGVDMVRDIRNKMSLAPMSGDVRVWLVDECFPAGTMIKTTTGQIPIEKIRKGQFVRNIQGDTVVEDVFINRVALDRVIKLFFDDGSVLITTVDHKFLTESGWVKARNLQGEVGYLGKFCYTNGTTNKRRYFHESLRNLQKTFRWAKRTKNLFSSMWLQIKNKIVWKRMYEEKKETPCNSNLSILWEGVHFKKQGKDSKMLFQELCFKSKRVEEGTWENGNTSVFGVSKDIHSSSIEQQSILQPVLCGEKQKQASGISRESVQQASSQKNSTISKTVQSNTRRKANGFREGFGKSRYQPNSGDYTKRIGNKKKEWNSTCLEGRARGKWKTNGTPIEIMVGIGNRQLGIGVGNTYSCATEKRMWLSNQLQGGYREQEIESGNRGGWDWSSTERDFIERCKEDPTVRKVRVDRIEVYERGCNESSFLGVIGDKEKNRGFVEFYDLQIEGHPSYFANGLTVHNCASLTKDAQNAFLKMLEDTPSHVYFFLATTDPQKLLKTIRTRATELKVKPLNSDDAEALVLDVAEKEGRKDLPEELVEKIIDLAQGSPRKLLVLLDQVIQEKDADRAMDSLSAGVAEKDAIELARMLLTGGTWNQVAKFLKGFEGLDDQAESIRWLVLSYMSTVALNSPKQAERVCSIMESFRDNWYDCKKAGLIMACREVTG